jgi:hypothetical protein
MFKRTARAAALALAAGLAAGPGAHAQAPIAGEHYALETVASALRLCAANESAPGGAYAIGFCYGWLEGVGQMYEAVVLNPSFDLKRLACPPREQTREEMRVIFVAWAQANPAEAASSPLVGLAKSVKEAFPCT